MALATLGLTMEITTVTVALAALVPRILGLQSRLAVLVVPQELPEPLAPFLLPLAPLALQGHRVRMAQTQSTPPRTQTAETVPAQTVQLATLTPELLGPGTTMATGMQAAEMATGSETTAPVVAMGMEMGQPLAREPQRTPAMLVRAMAVLLLLGLAMLILLLPELATITAMEIPVAEMVMALETMLLLVAMAMETEALGPMLLEAQVVALALVLAVSLLVTLISM